MSTQINIYHILGYKFDYDAFNENFKKSPEDDSAFEKIEPIHDSAFKGINEGLTALFDGNAGQYVVIGKVFNKTPDGQPFNDEIIEIKHSLQERKDIAKMINKFLGKKSKLESRDIKTFIVSHYR